MTPAIGIIMTAHGTPVLAGDVVVDCGASEGLWALTVMTRAGRVFLIEPQEVFARTLEKTFGQYIAAGTAEVLQYAVGAVDGQGELHGRFNGDIKGAFKQSHHGDIPLRRLDTLFERKSVDFIRVDVEGGEMDVLLGAERIIKRDKPKIALAVYHDVNDHVQMVDYVRSVVPEYEWRIKGIVNWGKPLMLHMWTEEPKRQISSNAVRRHSE